MKFLHEDKKNEAVKQDFKNKAWEKRLTHLLLSKNSRKRMKKTSLNERSSISMRKDGERDRQTDREG